MHAFRCYDNIASNAKCQRVLVLAFCLVYDSNAADGRITHDISVLRSLLRLIPLFYLRSHSQRGVLAKSKATWSKFRKILPIRQLFN